MYTRSPVPQHSPRDQNYVEEDRLLYNARLEYKRRIDNAEKMNKALMEKAAANFDRNKTDSDGEVEIIQVTGRHDFPPQTTREHKDRRSKRISLEGRTIDPNYSPQRTPEHLEVNILKSTEVTLVNNIKKISIVNLKYQHYVLQHCA